MPRPPDQHVGAAAALERVVAVLAVELVVLGVADELVVELRAEQVLDALERVAFRGAALALAGSPG